MYCDHLRGGIRAYLVVPVKFFMLLGCSAVNSFLVLCFNFGGASPHEVGATENHNSFSLSTNLYKPLFYHYYYYLLCALSDWFVILVNAELNKTKL